MTVFSLAWSSATAVMSAGKKGNTLEADDASAISRSDRDETVGFLSPAHHSSRDAEPQSWPGNRQESNTDPVRSSVSLPAIFSINDSHRLFPGRAELEQFVAVNDYMCHECGAVVGQEYHRCGENVPEWNPSEVCTHLC